MNQQMRTTLTIPQQSQAREAFDAHFRSEYGRQPNLWNMDDLKNWYHFRAGWERCTELPYPTAKLYVQQALERYGEEAARRAAAEEIGI
jgi:hypothetical protein